MNKKIWLFVPVTLIAGLAIKFSRVWVPPVLAKITSKFGTRYNPISNKTEFHNGIDLAVPVGTAITSPASGIIAKVYTNDLGGLQLVIKHNNGFSTGYAHLSKVFFSPGAKVSKGDHVALSGRSGNVTGPHLHFTMYDPGGINVDPEKYIYKT